MQIIDYELFRISDYRLTIFHLVYIISIYLGAKLFIFFIQKAFQHSSRVNKLDKGSRYALLQIIRYIVWTIVIILSLETLGVKVTILIAGSAALLVGIGLGLQQTFNDIISGVILLLEGSIKVGDILDLDGDIVKVNKIGLRTSLVENRNSVNYILPNSRIVTDQVINWNYDSNWSRFNVGVGVAYGTDVDLVMKILIDCVESHPKVLVDRKVIARLAEFGDSSLNFDILFWSESLFEIEQVKSDIRVSIVKALAQNNITIPFPQRDLHLKTNDTGSIN